MADSESSTRDAALFVQLIAIFQDAAMRHLGKLPVEPAGEIARDLEQARATIDMIEMLERRTRESRTEPESRFIERALLELRMNYVDESRRPDPVGSGTDGENSAESPPVENGDDPPD